MSLLPALERERTHLVLCKMQHNDAPAVLLLSITMPASWCNICWRQPAASLGDYDGAGGRKEKHGEQHSALAAVQRASSPLPP